MNSSTTITRPPTPCNSHMIDQQAKSWELKGTIGGDEGRHPHRSPHKEHTRESLRQEEQGQDKEAEMVDQGMVDPLFPS